MNRKLLEKALLQFNLSEHLGSSITPEQLSVLESAKLSILPLLDVYYQYQLQEILRYVRYDITKKFETGDQELIGFFHSQKSNFALALDDLTYFVSFNKRLLCFLIDHQNQVKIQYSPTKSPARLIKSQQIVFGKKQGPEETLLFQHQLNRLTFEEYYVKKRKPQKLEVPFD